MIKYYFLFLLICIAFQFNAQSFSNGSIFNFGIGDTIMEEYDRLPASGTNPPRYIFRAITGKTVNATSISYEEHRIVNDIVYTGSSYSIAVTNTIIVYQITNLTTVPMNDPWIIDTTCQFQFDTTFVDAVMCGRNVHVKELKMKPSPNQCFEPPTHRLTYIEGVGIYEHTVSLNSFPTVGMGFNHHLVYLHKNGSAPCGSKISISTSINEQTVEPLFNLFPNPTADFVHFQITKPTIVQLYSLMGKLITKYEVIPGPNIIDLRPLPIGIYFLNFLEDGRVVSQKIIKTD